MLAYIIQRVAQSAIAIFTMSVLVFLAVYAIGDPAYILTDPQLGNEQAEALRKVLGLDRPLWEQYWIFITRALQGNLGKSFIYGIDAIDLIFLRRHKNIYWNITPHSAVKHKYNLCLGVHYA